MARVRLFGTLTLQEIDNALGLGANLEPYRGLRVLDKGDRAIDLPYNDLSFSDFYGVRIKPDENYPTPVISQSLRLQQEGFFNTGPYTIDPQLSINYKNEQWPQYRPTPRSVTTLQWYFKSLDINQNDGFATTWVALPGETNPTLVLDPVASNNGLYKLEIKAELVAPNDAEIPTGAEDVVVAQATDDPMCVVNFREFTVGSPGIGGQISDMQPATVIVRTYENDVNGDPITDTESDELIITADYNIIWTNGELYGKPFDVDPTATISLQYGASASPGGTWTTFASTTLNPFERNTKGIEYSGTNPRRKFFAFPGAYEKTDTAITLSGEVKYYLDDFLDLNLNDQYIRVRIDAHCNYQNSGTSPGDTTTFRTDFQTAPQQLDIVSELVQRDNTPPDVPAVFTTFCPKGGTATRDILDFVTDADGDTITLTNTQYVGDGTLTTSGTSITMDLTAVPNLVSKAEDVTYTVSDNSTRPGGPGTGIGVLRFVTSNQPPVAGDTSIRLAWAGPGTGIVRKYTVDLTETSTDPNGDEVTLVPPVFTTMTGCSSFSFNSTSVTFTLNEGFAGFIEFGYEVKDAYDNISANKGTARIEIYKSNLAPFVNDGSRDVPLQYDGNGDPTTSIERINAKTIMGTSDYEFDPYGVNSVSDPEGRLSLDPLSGSYIYVDVTGMNVGSSFTGTVGFRANQGNTTEKFGTLTINVIAGCPIATASDITGLSLENDRVHNLRSIVEDNINTNGYGPAELTRWKLSATSPGNTFNTTPTGAANYNPNGGSGAFSIEYGIRNSCGSESSFATISGSVFTPNSAPVCSTQSKTGTHGRIFTRSAAQLGSDPDGDSMVIRWISGDKPDAVPIVPGDGPSLNHPYYYRIGYRHPPTLSHPPGGYIRETTREMLYSLVDSNGNTSGTCKFSVTWPEKKVKPEFSIERISNHIIYETDDNLGIQIKFTVKSGGKRLRPWNKPITLRIWGSDNGLGPENPDETARVSAHLGGALEHTITFNNMYEMAETGGTYTINIPTVYTISRVGPASWYAEATGDDWLSSANYASGYILDQPEKFNLSIPDNIIMEEGSTKNFGSNWMSISNPSGQDKIGDWQYFITGDVAQYFSTPASGYLPLTIDFDAKVYVPDGDFAITANELDSDYENKTGKLKIYDATNTIVSEHTLTVTNNDEIAIPTVSDIYIANRITEDSPVGEIQMRTVAILNADGTTSAIGTSIPEPLIQRWSNLNDNTGWTLDAKDITVTDVYGTVIHDYNPTFQDITPHGAGDVNAHVSAFGNRITLFVEAVPDIGSWSMNYPYSKFTNQTLNATASGQYRMLYVDDPNIATNYANFQLDLSVLVRRAIGGPGFRG